MLKRLTAILLSIVMLISAGSALAGTGIVFSQNPTQDKEEPAVTAQPAQTGDELPQFTGAVEYETHRMQDGLTFILPADWDSSEITDEMTSEGIFVILSNEEKGVGIEGRVEKLPEKRTPQQHSDAMNQDEKYLDTLLAENKMGAEVIAFFYADKTALGYCILDNTGFAIYFTYTHLDGSKITNDELVMNLGAEGADAVHFSTTSGSASPAPAAGGSQSESITVTNKTLNGNFVLPVPTDWEERELKEDDYIRLADEENGVYLYVRANKYNNSMTAEMIYDSFSTSENFSGVELLTGGNGVKMVKADAENRLFTTVMVPDKHGYVYIITFGSTESKEIVDNETMKLLREIMVLGIEAEQ